MEKIFILKYGDIMKNIQLKEVIYIIKNQIKLNYTKLNLKLIKIDGHKFLNGSLKYVYKVFQISKTIL